MSVIHNTIPVALSVAGSDCCCGAGAQADLKTFSAHGVYGLTALTCVVAEVPGRVTRIEQVAPSMLAEQLQILLKTFPVRVMKTGMIPSQEHVEALCSVLDSLDCDRVPLIVVDPVMVATSGDRLVGDPAITALRAQLFPRALLLTPNMAEAAVLLQKPVTSAADLELAARSLAQKYGTAVLVKGGHLEGGSARDCLATKDGELQTFETTFIPDRNTHGTGCTLSSAIAAGLANGVTLQQAVADAKRYVSQAIEHTIRWGSDGGCIDALNHFAQPHS